LPGKDFPGDDVKVLECFEKVVVEEWGGAILVRAGLG
jgi:hypothetical protein